MARVALHEETLEDGVIKLSVTRAFKRDQIVHMNQKVVVDFITSHKC